MPQSSYLRLSSGDVHVADSGGNGTLFVLVHGLGATHTSWVDIFDELSERGRTVAVDLPGYGYSPPIRRHDLDSLAAALIETIESFAQPVVLIGNSMGGLVAEMVAAARPDVISALILIAPASPAPSGARPTKPLVAARLVAQSVPGLGNLIAGLYRHVRDPEQRAESLLDTVAADPSRLSERARSTAMAMARRRDSFPWAVRALVESTASIRHMFIPRRNFTSLIASIEGEALVLSGGADDVVTPAAIDSLQSLRPDWTFHRLSGVGHVPQMEDPQWVLERIDEWLQYVEDHDREKPARAT